MKNKMKIQSSYSFCEGVAFSNPMCVGHKETNFSIQPFELILDRGSMLKKNKILSLLIEAHWIRQLGSQPPHGLDLKLYIRRNLIVSYSGRLSIPLKQISYSIFGEGGKGKSGK